MATRLTRSITVQAVFWEPVLDVVNTAACKRMYFAILQSTATTVRSTDRNTYIAGSSNSVSSLLQRGQ
jgi:hypothetical protein